MPPSTPALHSLDAWPGEAARPPLRLLDAARPARREAPPATPARPPRDSGGGNWLRRVRQALAGR